ncbi:MAG: hypothetical protein ABH810_01300 [bacterium]
MSTILTFTRPDQLDQIMPGMTLGQAEFEHIMKMLGLMWTYDGEPCEEKSHAQLASPMHSNGFFDVGSLMKGYPEVRWNLAQQLVDRFSANQAGPIHGVIGAPTSSTDLAGDVAEILRVRHFILDKIEGGIVWREDQENILGYECLLRVEELMTTASSCEKAMEAVLAGNPGWGGTYYPIVYTIVDRSDPAAGPLSVRGSTVDSLFRYEVRNFDPAVCPYCAVGSPALKPKENREIFFPNAVAA